MKLRIYGVENMSERQLRAMIRRESVRAEKHTDRHGPFGRNDAQNRMVAAKWELYRRGLKA